MCPLFMNQAFKTSKAQQILEAFTGICRISPYIVVLIFRIQQAWEYLVVMDIGRCHSVSTDKSMINVDADAVLVAVMADAILLYPASV